MFFNSQYCIYQYFIHPYFVDILTKCAQAIIIQQFLKPLHLITILA